MGCKCRYYSEAEKAKMLRSPAAKVIVPDAVLSVEDGHYGPYSENLAREGGDFIIRRSDGVFAYQLAVSVDDMEMGVTRVVRARDLLSSAPRQKWLIETLGGAARNIATVPCSSRATDASSQSGRATSIWKSCAAAIRPRSSPARSPTCVDS